MTSSRGRVTLGEDRRLIHTGQGPSIMAILRDTVVSVLHRAGWRTIAERLRFDSGNAHAALTVLGIPIIENAYALRPMMHLAVQSVSR